MKKKLTVKNGTTTKKSTETLTATKRKGLTAEEVLSITRGGKTLKSVLKKKDKKLPDLTDFRSSIKTSGTPLSEIVCEMRYGDEYKPKKEKPTLEDVFSTQLESTKLLNFDQYKFHPTRKWRFDFAWPTIKVAVEIQGGTWTGGAHVRGAGYEKDCEKLNNAVLLGWKVLYFTSKMVRSGEGLELLKRVLDNENY